MDGNCGEWIDLWVWLAEGGCGRNLWVWLVGRFVRRYIDFLILLNPTPLFCKKVSFWFMFFFCDLQIISYCRSFG